MFNLRLLTSFVDKVHCLKNVQILSFIFPFSLTRTKYVELLCPLSDIFQVVVFDQIPEDGQNTFWCLTSLGNQVEQSRVPIEYLLEF